MDKSIKRIHAVEEKAAKMVQDAVLQKQQAIQKAQKSTIARRAKLEEEIARLKEDELKKAEEAALKEVQTIEQETERAVEQLQRKAEKNMDRTADYIIGLLREGI